jgi:hypothetical protein
VAKYGFFYSDFAGRPSKLHLNSRSPDLESVQLDKDLAVDGKMLKVTSFGHNDRGVTNWQRMDSPGSVELALSTNVEGNGRSQFTDKEEVYVEEARLALEEGAENAPRVVRRVGRFGPSADLRPLWKVAYLLIVVSHHFATYLGFVCWGQDSER